MDIGNVSCRTRAWRLSFFTAVAILACLVVATQVSLAQDKGSRPQIAHTIMLDVSGSMNDSKDSQGHPNGHYGSVERGFDKNIAVLLEALLKPGQDYTSPEEPLEIFPFMYYGEEKYKKIDRQVLGGLHISDFQKALKDPRKVIGPGYGGFGESSNENAIGMDPQFNQALTKACQNDKADCHIFWMLTDNGAGRNSQENPRNLYKRLKTDRRVNNVWFVPIGRLSPNQGPLLLYIVASGKLPAGEKRFQAALKGALNNMSDALRKGWPDFKNPRLKTLRPLYAEESDGDIRKGDWILENDNFKTAICHDGQVPASADSEEDAEDSAWDTANSENDSYLVRMTESSDGASWYGCLRYDTYLDKEDWKLTNYNFNKVACELQGDDLVDGVEFSSDYDQTDMEEGVEFRYTWTFRVSRQGNYQGEPDLGKVFASGIPTVITCSGTSEFAPLTDGKSLASTLLIEDDRGIKHLKEIEAFGYPDGVIKSSNPRVGVSTHKINVILEFVPRPASKLPYVLGSIVGLLLLAGIIAFLRSGANFTFYWRMPQAGPSGSELNGSQKLHFGPTTKTIPISINAQPFATATRMGASLKISPVSPDMLVRCPADLGQEYCESMTDNDGNVHQVFWCLEREGSSANLSGNYAPNSSSPGATSDSAGNDDMFV